jgi:ribonuclease BN (tRNA processing enzyme)
MMRKTGIAHLAQNCNLLVHEVTMRDCNKSKAFRRGHSTAAMAGHFALSVRAQDLAVTHFGGEISANAGNLVFPEIAASVKRSYGRVPIFARDFLTLQVERRRNIAVATTDVVEDSTIWEENEEESDEAEIKE